RYRLDGSGRATRPREPARTGASDDAVTQMLWRQALALVLARRGEHTAAEEVARGALGAGRDTDMLAPHRRCGGRARRRARTRGPCRRRHGCGPASTRDLRAEGRRAGDRADAGAAGGTARSRGAYKTRLCAQDGPRTISRLPDIKGVWRFVIVSG